MNKLNIELISRDGIELFFKEKDPKKIPEHIKSAIKESSESRALFLRNMKLETRMIYDPELASEYPEYKLMYIEYLKRDQWNYNYEGNWEFP